MKAPGTTADGAGEEGAAIVEFAIVAGLFIVLLWGLLSYGAIFATKQAMSHAASEAALIAVSDPDGDIETTAKTVIGAQLEWLGHFGFDVEDPGAVAIVEEPCDGTSDVVCVRVTLTHSWRGQGAIIPPIAKVATPESLTEYAVVKAWN